MHRNKKSTKMNMNASFLFLYFNLTKYTEMNTVNTYSMPQGHKARTWVMP
jgi:hypothetical protein